MSPVSIKDIAKVLGVSHSTVSRALHDSPLVAAETRARIHRTAQEMGYSPSGIARSLVTRRTHTVGLVVTTITDPFWGEVIHGVEEACQEVGYSLLLCQSQAEPEREVAAVRILREKRVDAIVVAASRVGSLYLDLLTEIQVPVVLINNNQQGPYIHSVGTDNVYGARLVAEHLTGLGHRRLAYIGGPPTVENADRLRGFQQALAAADSTCDPLEIVPGNGQVSGGEAGLHQLLTLPHRPTAIFCYNDMTAIGVLRACHTAGLTVPGDLSVVGYDNIVLAAYTCPALTTVAQPMPEMGRRAAEMALALAGGAEVTSNVVLPVTLVVRESSARPGAG